MAWFMDSYSVHAGHAIREIVTGKPVSLGGVAGRRSRRDAERCSLLIGLLII